MRVAILHDWINRITVREKILENLIEVFPDADIYTFYTNEKVLTEKLKNKDIISLDILDYENRWSAISKFAPSIEELCLEKYDLVFCNSIGPMRWVKKKIQNNEGNSFDVVAYMDIPFPYIFLDQNKKSKSWAFKNLFNRSAANEETENYGKLDIEYVQGINLAITNSSRMKKILSDVYQIDAKVIYPPVNEQIFYNRNVQRDNFYILCSDLEEERGLSAVFETFNFLEDTLIVIGAGSQKEKWQEFSNTNIKFMDNFSATERAEIFSRCKGVIIPEYNRINNSAFEALRLGTPIICAQDSLCSEVITQGRHGIIYASDSVKEFMPTIFEFEEIEFDYGVIAKLGEQFSNENFKNQMNNIIAKTFPSLSISL